MLTADLAAVRRRGDELIVKRLDARAREECEAIAAAYLDAARAHVDASREDLLLAWDGVDVGKHARVAAGLKKLTLDACVFEEPPAEHPPETVRREVFLRAAAARRAGAFAREAILAEAAEAAGIDGPTSAERLLFADLRGEHLLRAAPTHTAASVVEAWELGQAQAVLLRAVRVVCLVEAASPGALRAFFGKLKFHGLLFSIEAGAEHGAVKITLDGPLSMFESSTRYGLKLALVLPALRDLERWSLEADVRWGRERAPCVLRLTSGARRGAAKEASGGDAAVALHVSDDVQELMRGIQAAKTPWRAEIAQTILDHPGAGLSVPDIVLRREDLDEPVYVELLGFWSRDAVWRRVELARAGAGARVVFCVSARLRVSPDVLSEDDDAALYVYKTKPNARALLDRVARLVYPAAPCTSSSPERRAGSAKRSRGST